MTILLSERSIAARFAATSAPDICPIRPAPIATLAISSSVGNGSYNIVMNNGSVAGQVVMHAHLHIIPRFKDDRLRLKWSHKKYNDNEIEEFQQKIMKFV